MGLDDFRDGIGTDVLVVQFPARAGCRVVCHGMALRIRLTIPA